MPFFLNIHRVKVCCCYELDWSGSWVHHVTSSVFYKTVRLTVIAIRCRTITGISPALNDFQITQFSVETALVLPFPSYWMGFICSNWLSLVGKSLISRVSGVVMCLGSNLASLLSSCLTSHLNIQDQVSADRKPLTWTHIDQGISNSGSDPEQEWEAANHIIRPRLSVTEPISSH